MKVIELAIILALTAFCGCASAAKSASSAISGSSITAERQELEVQGTRVDRVVAVVNDEPLTFFDLNFAHSIRLKQKKDMSFYFGFSNQNSNNNENLIIGLIDEKILAKTGYEKIKREIAKKVENFDKFIEERDGPDNYYDSERPVSGTLTELTRSFKKIIGLGKLTKEEKIEFEKILEDWEDFLLADLLFPGNGYNSKELEIWRLIYEQAEQFNVTPHFIRGKLLEKSFVKQAVEELWDEIERIFISPAEIKVHYDNYQLKSIRVNHALVKTESTALWALGKIEEGKMLREIGIISVQSVESDAINSLTLEIKAGVYKLLEEKVKAGFVKSNSGYHIIQIEKISFREAQEKISANLWEQKTRERVDKFMRKFRSKTTVGVAPDFYSPRLQEAGYGFLYQIGG